MSTLNDNFLTAYKRLTDSFVPLVGEVNGYVQSTNGKQLRPQLTMLSACCCGLPSDIDADHPLFAITAAIEKANDAAYTNDDNTKKSKAELEAIQTANFADIIKDYGEKFYLVYMADDNSSASEFEEGFKFLSDNWNNESFGLKANDISPLQFKLHVINSSEESSNDSEFEKNPSQTTAWKRYLINYTGLFNVAGPWLYEHMPMVINSSMSEDKFTSFSVSSADNEFPVPTVCLCDFTLEAIADGRAGLSEVTFASTGATANEKAKNLLNMWNHLDPYSSNNSYTSTSKKEYRVAR
jgi:hypothetical protein